MKRLDDPQVAPWIEKMNEDLPTHDLMEILDLLITGGASELEALAGDCALLSRYAVLTR